MRRRVARKKNESISKSRARWYNKIMADIAFDIVKHFGVISEEKGGWKKELNLVSWNGRTPKLDVRDWAPGHEKMGKGVTLSKDEAAKLAELLKAAAQIGIEK
jgi:hypothetical protein